MPKTNMLQPQIFFNTTWKCLEIEKYIFLACIKYVFFDKFGHSSPLFPLKLLSKVYNSKVISILTIFYWNFLWRSHIHLLKCLSLYGPKLIIVIRKPFLSVGSLQSRLFLYYMQYFFFFFMVYDNLLAMFEIF